MNEQTVQTAPATPGGGSTQLNKQTAAIKAIGRGTLGQLSEAPRIANQLIIPITADQKITFSTGLYLVLSGAEGGKSITSLAIAALAGARGVRNVGSIYVFEPGAKEYAMGYEHVLFEDAAVFLKPLGDGDLDIFTKMALIKTTEGEPSVLVVDSINDPLKSYNPEGRVGSGTGEKGMQQEDRAFCTKLNNWALARNTVLLGTLNTEMISFAARLNGVVEGVIDVTAPGQFTKRERSTGRVPNHFILPTELIDVGAEAMGYGVTRRTAKGGRYVAGLSGYGTGTIIDH